VRADPASSSDSSGILAGGAHAALDRVGPSTPRRYCYRSCARLGSRGAERRWTSLIEIEYYASSCPRRGLTHDDPPGLFRVARGDRWLAAHYLGDGEWRRTPLLLHEIMSPIASLERISIEEAMTVLSRRGGRPDSLDDRARHPSAGAAVRGEVEVALAESVAQD